MSRAPTPRRTTRRTATTGTTTTRARGGSCGFGAVELKCKVRAPITALTVIHHKVCRKCTAVLLGQLRLMDRLSGEEVFNILLCECDVLEQGRFWLFPDGKLTSTLPVGTTKAHFPLYDVPTTARTHSYRRESLPCRDNIGVHFRMRLLQEIFEHSQNVLFQLLRRRLPLMYLLLNDSPQGGEVRSTKGIGENAIQLASKRSGNKGLPLFLQEPS